MQLSKHKTFLGAGFLGILIAGFALSCAQSDGEKRERAVAKDAEETAIPVEVQMVAGTPMTETIASVGTIEAWHDVMVSAEGSGRVIEVIVDEGDAVSKGGLILRLDEEWAALDVAQAEAQTQMARAHAAKSKRDLNRNEELFGTNDISVSQIEDIRLGAETAEAAMISAEVALKRARRQLADTEIKSPIAGKVALRHVDVGERVAPGAPVATVVDLSRIKVEISLSEREIAQVRVGQKAHLTVAAYPGKRFEGTVSRVGLKADAQARAFPVQIAVSENPDEHLKSGMIARVGVDVNTNADVLLIPQDAVLERMGEQIVYVVVNNKAVKRSLDLGRRWDERVVVESGLTPGEQLVVAGQENLSEGMQVAVEEISAGVK
ncbi:MAG: efflux RND transporter periplasmic adaptor subunit [Candidatus Latescibacterota bacterium]